MNWQIRLRAPSDAGESLHVALSDAAVRPQDRPMLTFLHPAPTG